MNRGFVYLIVLGLLFAGSGPLVWGQENQIENPEFDDGLTSWGRYGAAGYTVEAVAGARLSGPNAALMDVTDASVVSVGIAQGGLQFERGKKYPVGVTAKADKEREMVILIQLYKPEGPSWIDIVLQRVSLTTEPQTFVFEYTHNDDSMADHPTWQATLYLMLKGQWWVMENDTIPSKVWVDRVHVGEQPPLMDSTVRSASEPQPADGATDVPRDTNLSWRPGEFIATHDVYFGSAFADVNAADRANPMGVLVGEDQTTVGYDPDSLLEYDRTYYWRIDEVNGAPDYTLFRGAVWSFTTEPFAYPITGVTATASSAQPGMDPQNTVNGAGLNDNDEHSTQLPDMWMSAGVQPNWIQFELDDLYKLHEMWVWNSNQLIETLLGFGARNVTVEYSTDGTTWTALENVPEFARATASAAYTANTIVDFGGAMARFVKLTINQNWGGIAPQTGLSEVRFYQIPIRARTPMPADGAIDVGLDAELSWRPGREATSHQVHFGADSNPVAVGAVTEHSYAPASLDLGTTYYWRIDEVSDSGVFGGDVWSFTTQPHIVVEDFESYNDDDNRIYDSWIDGLTDPAKGGSQVGYDASPFAEKTIRHGGGQSMPLIYDNTGKTVAEATFALDQDWTAHGIRSLSLYFRGTAGNSGKLYLKINNTKVAYNGPASDIAQTQWLPWNVDLTTVGGNLSSVNSLTLGVEGSGATGTLFIDDIRLYPQAPEFTMPVQPDNADLVARYTFDGNLRDSVGANHGTASGDAKVVSDPARGQVLSVDGNGDKVDVPYSAALNPEAFTVSLWAWPDSSDNDYRSPLTSRDDLPQRGYILYIEPGNTWQFWTGTGTGWNNTPGPLAQMDEWSHVAATLVNGEKKLYINGRLVGQTSAAFSLNTQQPLRIGAGGSETAAGNYFFRGYIDEVRLYDRALSAEEIAGLAGHTNPLPKPF